MLKTMKLVVSDAVKSSPSVTDHVDNVM